MCCCICRPRWGLIMCLVNPLLPAVPLLIAVLVPISITWLAVVAHYSAVSIATACLAPTVGVICFLVAPVASAPQAAPDAPTNHASAEPPNVLERMSRNGKNLMDMADTKKWLNADKASQSLSSWCGLDEERASAFIAKSLQASMGAFALVGAYAVLSNLHAIPPVSAAILGVSSLVQATDSLAWLLADVLELKAVGILRDSINLRKDAFEERCVSAADGLIESTRALAIVLAQRVRVPATAGGENKPSAALRPWERAALMKVDSMGHVIRSSPLKCLVSTLNVVLTFDALRAGTVAPFFSKMAQSMTGLPFLNHLDNLPASWEAWVGVNSVAGSRVWSESIGWRNSSRCEADGPCQVLSRAPSCASGSSWVPSCGSVITVEYRQSVGAKSVAIHYQWLRPNASSFTLRLEMHGEVYRLLVRRQQRASLSGLTQNAFELSLASSGKDDSASSCPVPMLLQVAPSAAPIQQLSVSLDDCFKSGYGPTVGITGILLAESKEADSEESKDSPGGDKPAEIDQDIGNDDFQAQADADGGFGSDADGGFGSDDFEGGEFKSDEFGGGGGSQVPPVGAVAAAAGAAATAAASTDFVRRRTRPSEYASSKAKEGARHDRKSRRGEAEKRLRAKIATEPLDLPGAKEALMEAQAIGVAKPITEDASKFINGQAGLMAARAHLSRALTSANDSQALSYSRSGKGTSGLVGTAKRFLRQVDDDLVTSISESRKVGLSEEEIAEALAVLAEVRASRGVSDAPTPAPILVSAIESIKRALGSGDPAGDTSKVSSGSGGTLM